MTKRKSSDERKSERKMGGRLCLKGKAPSPTRGIFLQTLSVLLESAIS